MGIKLKTLLLSLLVALSLASAGAVLIAKDTSALSGSDFKPGRIIDDALFYNGSTMSVSQIQNFLNSKLPTCDTNGTQSYSYYYNPSTGEINNKNEKWDGDQWVTTSRATYGQRAYAYTGVDGRAPYTCLKNYKQNVPYRAGESGLCSAINAASNQSAAQIIDTVARACNISQKVLIVTLQKEQGLITDDWPWGVNYKTAMGYGCPDNAPCDEEYFGFFNQVYNAARQFQRYKADPTNWNHVPFMTNQVRYDVETSCGTRSVYIENYATAGLYNYTPYTPNAAALNNLYGTGDGCSAYGNRNFWRYYNDWFGFSTYSTQGSIGLRYNEIGGASRIGHPTSEEITLSTGGKYQQFERGRIYWKSGVGAWEVVGSIGQRYIQARADTGALGYPIGSESTLTNGAKYQEFEGGRIYWESGVGAHSVFGLIGARYIGIDADKSRLGLPISNEITLSTGGKYQQFERGRIYWKKETGAWDIGGAIGIRYYTELSDTSSALKYPIGSETSVTNGIKYQDFEGGRIYWISKSGTKNVYGLIGHRYLEMSAHESRLGLPTGHEITLSTGGKYQQFERGRIYWKKETGAWDLGGGIGTKYYTELTGASSALKYPTGPEQTVSSGLKYQLFEGGLIYWSREQGTSYSYGSIGQHYTSIDSHDSRLGLPTGHEITLSTGGKYQQFERGRIYWKKETGAWDIGGAMGYRYLQVGADSGRLGYPTGVEVSLATGGKYQQFEGGRIYWKSGVGAWDVAGAIGNRYIQLGADNSPLGYPTGKELVNRARTSVSQQFEHGTITYTYATRQTTYATE